MDNRRHAHIVGIYLLLVFTVANLKNIEKSGILLIVNQLILWGGGLYMFFKYFLPTVFYKTRISEEFILYASLILFSLFGLYKVISFPDYFRYLQVIVSNLILMIIVYKVVVDKQNLLIVLKYLWIAFFITSVVSLYLEIDDLSSLYFRLRGITGNANGTANIARLCILITFLIFNLEKISMKVSILMSASVFLNCYIILLTASRGAFLNLAFIMAVIGLNYYFLSRNKLRNTIFIAMTLFFGLSILVSQIEKTYVYERLTRNDNIENTIENDSRGQLYTRAIEITLDHPLVGVGLNQFKHYSGGLISHTDLLDISAQLGILAALLYSLIYVILISRIKRFWPLVNRMFSERLSFILLIFLLSEVFYGLINPNWFTQAQMVILAIIISFYTQVVQTEFQRYKLDRTAQ